MNCAPSAPLISLHPASTPNILTVCAGADQPTHRHSLARSQPAIRLFRNYALADGYITLALTPNPWCWVSFYDFRLRGLLVKSRVFWASYEQKAPKAKENFIFQQKSVCLYHTALIKNNTKVFVWFRLEYTIESNGTFKSEYREHVFAFFNLQGHICHFFCYQNLVFELMKHRNFKKSEVKAQIGLFIFRCENLLFSIKK